MATTYEIDLTDSGPGRAPAGPPAHLTQDPAVFWRWVNNMTRRAQGWALVALGAVVLIVGYMGVAREALIAKQLPYLASGGIGGLALVALGAMFIVSDDLRHDTRRTEALEQRVDHIEEMVADLHAVLLTAVGDGRADRAGSRAASRAAARPDEPAAGATQVVVLPSGQRFHRSGCTLVQDKPNVSYMSADDARRQQLSPCLVCEPALVPA